MNKTLLNLMITMGVMLCSGEDAFSQRQEPAKNNKITYVQKHIIKRLDTTSLFVAVSPTIMPENLFLILDPEKKMFLMNADALTGPRFGGANFEYHEGDKILRNILLDTASVENKKYSQIAKRGNTFSIEKNPISEKFEMIETSFNHAMNDLHKWQQSDENVCLFHQMNPPKWLKPNQN